MSNDILQNFTEMFFLNLIILYCLFNIMRSKSNSGLAQFEKFSSFTTKNNNNIGKNNYDFI